MNLEERFLDAAFRYGVTAHSVVGEVLLEGYRAAPSDSPTRHLFTVRMFGEAVACLETFGAWSYSVASRFRHGGFLHSLLSYEARDVKAFYQAASRVTETVDLLFLPSVDIIAGATRMYPHQATDAELIANVQAVATYVREAATEYLALEGSVINVYNKTKHALPVLPGDSANSFIVLAHDPSARGAFVEASFTASEQRMAGLLSTIDALTSRTQNLAALLRILGEAGLLYRDEERRRAHARSADAGS